MLNFRVCFYICPPGSAGYAFTTPISLACYYRLPVGRSLFQFFLYCMFMKYPMAVYSSINLY